jgi:DNA-directed RNA polymerase specialized sigma24 family protein
MAKKRKDEFSWKEDRLLIQIAPASAPREEAAVIFRRSVEAARWHRPPARKAEGEGQVVMAYPSTPWTPEDDTLLRKLVLENEAPFEIAEQLGRSISSVRARAHRLGIPLVFLLKQPD